MFATFFFSLFSPEALLHGLTIRHQRPAGCSTPVLSKIQSGLDYIRSLRRAARKDEGGRQASSCICEARRERVKTRGFSPLPCPKAAWV